MASAMARPGAGVRLFAKSAILWLTVGVIFASVYGALLASKPSRASLVLPAAEAVVAVNTETDQHAN